MRYTEIDEAGRIGSGIHIREIPADFKNLKVLNRGTTSLILEKDPNTVIILTKDGIKRDWLVNELGIATQIGYYDSWHPKLKDMPIYALEMPKLYPLGPTTRKAAKDLIKTYNEIFDKVRWRHVYNQTHNKTKELILNKFYELFDQYNQTNTNEHALSQLVNFLANYNAEQYEWDLRMANLMQDKSGNLVILDPIVDSEILNAFTKR